jgi:hypothetical protein
MRGCRGEPRWHAPANRSPLAPAPGAPAAGPAGRAPHGRRHPEEAQPRQLRQPPGQLLVVVDDQPPAQRHPLPCRVLAGRAARAWAGAAGHALLQPSTRAVLTRVSNPRWGRGAPCRRAWGQHAPKRAPQESPSQQPAPTLCRGEDLEAGQLGAEEGKTRLGHSNRTCRRRFELFDCRAWWTAPANQSRRKVPRTAPQATTEAKRSQLAAKQRRPEGHGRRRKQPKRRTAQAEAAARAGRTPRGAGAGDGGAPSAPHTRDLWGRSGFRCGAGFRVRFVGWGFRGAGFKGALVGLGLLLGGKSTVVEARCF